MNTKKSALAAAVAAGFASFGANAQTDIKQTLDINISGQLNRAILYADDGEDSELFHVDNDNSSTRLRLDGSAELRPGLKAGVLLEVEFQSAPSNVVDFADRDGDSPDFDERHVDLFFEGGFGKVSMGQGDGAANGAVEVDLSGTTVAHYADVPAVGGGFEFRTPGAGFGPAFGSVLTNQDFESRYDRVRYDTPAFGGFGFGVSHGVKEDADVWEMALRYAGELAGLGRIAGAFGYSKEEDALALGTEDDETVGGSVSFLHTSGFNATLGHTNRDLIDRDGKFTYVKLGYKWANHAVSVDYALGDDQAAEGDEATSMSLAYVWSPVRWAELFGLVKQAELDRPGASLDDLRFFMAGTRLRF